MQAWFAALARVLESMAKRGFPRSRQARIYQLDGPEARGQELKKI